MSFGRHHPKADRTHTPDFMRLRTRKQKFTLLRIASLALRAFCFPSFLSAALDICLVIGQITKPQTSVLSHLTCSVNIRPPPNTLMG